MGRWVASELRSRQGRAYSIEREPHVFDEKEPDIRLRAKESDASLPIEIKVPESWSLNELESADRQNNSTLVICVLRERSMESCS